MTDVEVSFENSKEFKDAMENLAETIAENLVENSLPFKLDLAKLFLEHLLNTYASVRGAEDSFEGKLGTWLEAKNLSVEQVLKEYPDNIEIVQEGDEVYVRPTTEEWGLIAAALEFGTRLSAPISHWGLASQTFFSVNKEKIDMLFGEYIASGEWNK